MDAPRIVAIPGSLRAGSFNRKLLAVAVAVAREAGAQVDAVDLKTLALPVYDGDIEAAGFPASATELKERIAGAAGLLIATPEYNWGMPAGLKNAIDWASRGGSNPFRDKAAALLSASPGRFGAIRSAAQLRQTLTALGVHVLPRELNLPSADKAFAEDGSLGDPRIRDQVVALVHAFLERLA